LPGDDFEPPTCPPTGPYQSHSRCVHFCGSLTVCMRPKCMRLFIECEWCEGVSGPCKDVRLCDCVCVGDALDKLSGCLLSLLWCLSCLCVSAKQTEFCAWPIKRCRHPATHSPGSFVPPRATVISPITRTRHPFSISHFPAIFRRQPHFVHHNMGSWMLGYSAFGELLALISMCGMSGLHSVELKDPQLRHLRMRHSNAERWVI